jgi:hypothetical protein
MRLSLPSFQILSSLLYRLILEGAINYWINQRIAHSEEKNARLQVLTESLIRIHEHEDKHHGIVWGPADDECCNNYNRNAK